MKKIILILISFFTVSLVFSASGRSTEIVEPNHWVYNELYLVFTDAKLSSFIENSPMSVGEIQFHLKEVDYDSLSELGKTSYNKIKAFLSSKDDFLPNLDVRLFANGIFCPEAYYRTDTDIPYTFNYSLRNRFINVPFYLGWGDLFTIGVDFNLGMNYGGMHADDCYTNIPINGQFDMRFPRFATFSSGYTFDNWGFNVHVGKEGVSVGKTLLGSIIINQTFEPDFYFQTAFYSNWIKYTMNIFEVESSKYLYTHHLNFRPFKCLKVGVMEGSLLQAPFELRYINPLTIMHGFASWWDYDLTATEYKYYHEGHFAAYFCVNFEYMPVSNLRIYGLYAQNEILDFGWEHQQIDLTYPDSLGFQLGVEYNLHISDAYVLQNTLEAVYTSPYLYIKQSPEWSLYRSRSEQISGATVDSWLGSPFGPDCFAVTLQSKFIPFDKWSVKLGYMFKIHGENRSSTMFTTRTVTNEDGEEETIYDYYPYAGYVGADSDEEREYYVKKARNMWMSGIKEYTHQITLAGEYSFLPNLTVYGQTAYTIIFNADNVSNNFHQGLEFALGCEYKIF